MEKTPMKMKAIIYDLDGVIVSTDECHYLAWKRLADEENIPFDRTTNNRLRGISRMDSLAILLERSPRLYTPEEKLALAERKNGYYLELIQKLSSQDILPGFLESFAEIKTHGYKTAIASSSKNARAILSLIKLDHYFDAVVDGNAISRSKPDPEVFLLAAKALHLKAGECYVIDDSHAGIEAADRGGFIPLGIGDSKDDPRAKAHLNDLYGLIPLLVD
jgi:beta-phosphoglucomutase